MKITAGGLAEKIGALLIGEPNTLIEKLGEIEDGSNPETVVIAVEKKSLQKIKNFQPKIVVLRADIPSLDAVKLIVNKGKEVLIEVLNIFFPEEARDFISERASVASSVKLGHNVQVYPGVYLGENVVVGDGTIIYPNVVVYNDCQIGTNCIIHANAVIGADGFGFIQQLGKHIKVPQKGTVVVGNDVEIGACTTIDRATIKSTIIGDGTKIDNKVQIAHNVRIGKNCIIAGSANIAGSSVLEDNVILAGGAGVVDNITVGANTIVYACTVLTADCPPNSKIYGTPAGDDYLTAMKRRAIYNKLPELASDLKKLQGK